MDEQIKKPNFWKEYLITTVITLLIGTGLFFFIFLVINSGGLVGAVDGTGLTGIILVCVGLLIYISREGFFDVFSYGFKQLGTMIFSKRPNEHNDFAGYKNDKRIIRETKSKYYLFVILVGLLFVTAFIILEIIFHS